MYGMVEIVCVCVCAGGSIVRQRVSDCVRVCFVYFCVCEGERVCSGRIWSVCVCVYVCMCVCACVCACVCV
jgi:hypothetical protein